MAHSLDKACSLSRADIGEAAGSTACAGYQAFARQKALIVMSTAYNFKRS